MPSKRTPLLLIVLVVILNGCRQERAPMNLVDFPARNSPNYQGLVSVHWLKKLLDYKDDPSQNPRPDTYAHNRFVVLEASWASLADATDYHAGHVPGAYHLNTDEFENGYPQWRLREPADLQATIGRMGITPNTTVIVYGKQPTAAARVWWVLKFSGVSDVRILDGGFEAWSNAGYPIEKATNTQQPTPFEAPVATNILATTKYIRDRLDSTEFWMADVRSDDEFAGVKSGYSYLSAKGRIPNAIAVGDAGDGAFIYLQEDHRLRNPKEILDRWREQGIVPAKENSHQFEREVIFYCGGGWRSSLAFFYAWLEGFENIRNYSDGWSGWSTIYSPDPDIKGITPGWQLIPTANPIETSISETDATPT